LHVAKAGTTTPLKTAATVSEGRRKDWRLSALLAPFCARGKIKVTETNLIPASEVRALLGGITDMTLWRWLQDEQLALPQPIRIKTRRYWRNGDLNAWLEEQGGAANAN
jgi:predicted DNA-binding transcriptional regulator AlpA